MTKLVEAIASGDLDAVKSAVDAAEDVATAVNAEDPETWLSPLHHAAKHGAVEVAKLLLDHGADPNLEDVSGRTCLHVACDAYAEDETGDFCWEDMIVDLVTGGAVAVNCEAGKLPSPGDDAAMRVASAIERALAAGKTARKEQEGRRRLKKKEKFDAIMEGKLDEHISNASACSIAVCDTADTEGYKFGSRG